jgi:hypothetical protein
MNHSKIRSISNNWHNRSLQHEHPSLKHYFQEIFTLLDDGEKPQTIPPTACIATKQTVDGITYK